MSEIDFEAIEYPIPFRDGIIVRLRGIPLDFSREEAEKVALVVLALVSQKK